MNNGRMIYLVVLELSSADLFPRCSQVLGDKIGIMKDGKLACAGTPLELKHKYECGYELLVRQFPPESRPGQSGTAKPMILRPTSAVQGSDDSQSALRQSATALESFVLSSVPGANRHALHPVPNEMRFTLPLSARPMFGRFLSSLEQEPHLNLENYGISMAPFEEVFLKVGAESSVIKHSQKNRRSSDGGEDMNPSAEANSNLNSDEWYRSVGENVTFEPTFYRQARGIFLRRLLIARHSLGVDFYRLGLLPAPKGVSSPEANGEKKSGSAIFRAVQSGSLPSLGSIVRDLQQIPGMIRGVQTWLLVGIPLAAAAVAIWLRADTKNLYFLFPRTGQHPSPTEAFVPNMLTAAMFSVGYLFVPGFIAEVLVSEREAKVRNLLAVMGVNPKAYWCGHALADAVLLAIPVFGTWIGLEYVGLDDFTDGGAGGSHRGPGVFFALQSLFILELLSFSYACSHGFSTPAFAMAIIPALCLGLLILPIFIMLITLQFDQMANDNPEDRMTMRILFSILVMCWAALGPHGFFLASCMITLFPHKVRAFLFMEPFNLVAYPPPPPLFL